MDIKARDSLSRDYLIPACVGTGAWSLGLFQRHRHVVGASKSTKKIKKVSNYVQNIILKSEIPVLGLVPHTGVILGILGNVEILVKVCENIGK